MKAIFLSLLLALSSLKVFGEIVPANRSSCVPLLKNLRVIDINIDEEYRGEKAIKVTFKSNTAGQHQYIFTDEHVNWGMALIGHIEPRAGNFKRK